MDRRAVLIRYERDVERARREARDMARRIGFTVPAAEAVALSVSELATNLLRYAHDGQVAFAAVVGPTGPGIRVESDDRGPGIPDVERAMQDGFSTGGGLGSGLPGARRLMDQFEIRSTPAGTRIVAYKWTKGS